MEEVCCRGTAASVSKWQKPGQSEKQSCWWVIGKTPFCIGEVAKTFRKFEKPALCKNWWVINPFVRLKTSRCARSAQSQPVLFYQLTELPKRPCSLSQGVVLNTHSAPNYSPGFPVWFTNRLAIPLQTVILLDLTTNNLQEKCVGLERCRDKYCLFLVKIMQWKMDDYELNLNKHTI